MYNLRIIFVICLLPLIMLACSSDKPEPDDIDIPRPNDMGYEISIIQYREKLNSPDLRHEELVKMYQNLDRLRNRNQHISEFDLRAMHIQVHIINILERKGE